MDEEVVAGQHSELEGRGRLLLPRVEMLAAHIILRKRSTPQKQAGEQPAWVEAQDTTVLHENGTPMSFTLNRAFITDPSLMLGRSVVSAHGMYGRNEFTAQGGRARSE